MKWWLIFVHGSHEFSYVYKEPSLSRGSGGTVVDELPMSSYGNTASRLKVVPSAEGCSSVDKDGFCLYELLGLAP